MSIATMLLSRLLGRHQHLDTEGKKITGLPTPTAASDAASKSYVDTAVLASEGAGYTPAVAGNYPGTAPTAKADALDRLAARTINFRVQRPKVAADDAAGDATALFIIGVVPFACTIVKAEFIPDDALTADNTNYATPAVTKGDGTGGAATAVASATTQITGTGDWTAGKAVDLGTISNPTCAAGTVLGGAITKTAAGVVVPGGVWSVTVKPASGA